MRVICTRPNASTEINGVKFTPTKDGTGVISDEVSEEVAALFLSIPGYHDAEGDDQGGQEPPAPPAVVKPTAAPKAPAAPKTAGKKAAAPVAPVPPVADAEPRVPPAVEPTPIPDAPPAPDDETAF